MTRIYSALAALLLIAVVAALQPGAGPREARAQTPVAINIVGFAFAPGTVTVPLGTAVTWTNRDGDPHTASGSGWNSGVLSQGQSFTYVTQQAGSFAYICEIHPDMSGTLTVTGGNQTTPTPTPTPTPTSQPTASPAAGTTTATPSPTASPSPSPTPTAPAGTQPTVVSTPVAAATAASGAVADSDDGSSGVLIWGIVSVVLFSIGAGIMLVRRRMR